MKTGAKASPFAENIDFRVFSGDISVVKTADGELNIKRPQVRGIGSSECEDLSGDRMLKSAMDDMSKYSIRSPIWLNHRYDIPDDVFGALHQAPVIKTFPPGGPGLLNPNSPYYGVEIVADVARNNEAAMKSFNIINDDNVRLGFSIGCEITDWDIRKNEDDIPQGLDISHLMVYEWSLVGIPCNQQSWVQNAVKGLFNKAASLPKYTTEEEKMYISKHYRDFDDVTALFIHRNFSGPAIEKIMTDQKVYRKYGLNIVKSA